MSFGASKTFLILITVFITVALAPHLLNWGERETDEQKIKHLITSKNISRTKLVKLEKRQELIPLYVTWDTIMYLANRYSDITIKVKARLKKDTLDLPHWWGEASSKDFGQLIAFASDIDANEYAQLYSFSKKGDNTKLAFFVVGSEHKVRK